MLYHTIQLCIRLNDIEYVREELSKIPEAFKFDAVISRLAEVEGDEKAAISKHALAHMIEVASDNVVLCFKDVVQCTGEQVRNYMHHLHAVYVLRYLCIYT